LKLIRQPASGCGRAAFSGGEQGFGAGSGPGRNLGGKHVEAAPDDRLRCKIKAGDAGRVVECVVGTDRCRLKSRKLLDERKHVPELRNLVGGIDWQVRAIAVGLVPHRRFL
jgi:hypothetical protein